MSGRTYLVGGLWLAASSWACSSSVNVVGNEPADGSVDDGTPPTSSITLGATCSTPGALGCNGHAQKLQLLCDGGKWVANGTCAGQQICDTRPGSTTGSCQDPLPYCIGKAPGEAVCDGATRHVCGADLLDATSATCANEELCRAGFADKCATCTEGQHLCVGEKLRKCSTDHASFVDEATCDTPALCHAAEGLCEAPACTVDEVRCVGDALVKCNADRSLLVLVKECLPGSCDATAKDCRECVAGAKDCAGTTPRLCDSSNHWTTLAACAGATPICTAGACESGSCTAGVYRCNVDDLEKCNASSTGYDLVKACPAGLCDAAAKECTECKTGDAGCVGKRPRSCVAGHWVSASADCSSSTPYCEVGACVSSPTTTFTFPTISAHMSSGAPLGLGGGGRFRTAGDSVDDGGTGRSVAFSQLDLDIRMSDTMDPTACGGAAQSWDVYVNSKNVGSYGFAPTGADHRVTKSFTFTPILPITGSAVEIKIVATTSVCAGGGAWNWYPGGTAKVR